jgi:tRNA dimethylallyltransferase
MVGHTQRLGLAGVYECVGTALGRPDDVSALLIAGPTASGKSALAIELAKKCNGAVINADSMQVYADLHIITARPTAEEIAHIPHFMFGHVDGAVNYSVGKWLEDIAVLLPRLRSEGYLPIITGGTGMYFKALTQGLSPIPAVPDEVREQLRARAQELPVEALHDELKRLDPDMAGALRPTDRQRLIRALEVFEATGQSLAYFQSLPALPALVPQAQCLSFFLAPERAPLHERINARFEAMVTGGAMAEVEQLAARGLDPHLPVMRAHGVPALMAHIRGELTLAEAIERGQSDTRHYVKRQFTFARHQLPDFKWVNI